MTRGRKPEYPPEFTVGDLLLRDQPRGRGRKAISPKAIERALNEPFVIPTEPKARPVREISVQDLDLPSRAAGPMKALQIRTVGDLLATRRTNLLAQRRFGEISLRRVQRELLDVLFPKYVGDGRANGPASFESMVRSFVERTIKDGRKARLALGRLAPGLEHPRPLREFGQRHGLSRERIRQIANDALTRLRKPAVLATLNPFWAEVCAILESWGRPIPLFRLADALCRRLGWPEAPPGAALGRLLALNEGLAVSNGTVALSHLIDEG